MRASKAPCFVAKSEDDRVFIPTPDSWLLTPSENYVS